MTQTDDGRKSDIHDGFPINGEPVASKQANLICV
jgi:hypothetical protein